MSSKNWISEVELKVEVRPTPGTASCRGTPTASLVNDNLDTKKVVAFNDVSFGGKCVAATVKAESVSSAGPGVTTHTLCYYAGVNDDQFY